MYIDSKPTDTCSWIRQLTPWNNGHQENDRDIASMSFQKWAMGVEVPFS